MEPSDSARPLTARSIIASTLLGASPPALPSQLLVRSGELFGIAEGTTRTALSRMVAAGELEVDDGVYRLAGPLLARQARQAASRRPASQRWNRRWEMAVVVVDRRSASARAELREAMRRLKLAELREGVWLRPDNLGAERSGADLRLVDDQCTRFTVEPVADGTALAARLWDLMGWAREAADLRTELDRLVGPLEAGRTDVLAAGFVLSAAVLRHLLADPQLPTELQPSGWPGDALRREYDRYDAAFKAVWRDWFRSQTHVPR